MRLGIAGAGMIGCHTGGMLAAGGHEVVLLGRPALCEAVGREGLRLSDHAGGAWRAEALECVTSPEGLAGCEVVFVCVKSRDTEAMGRALAPHLGPGCVVVSLQNGVRNAEILRAVLPGREVRGGMVPYNVVSPAPGRYHKATSGEIALEAGPGDLAEALDVPGLIFEEHADFEAVAWGKLLANLNNALNALSGLPLREQLMQRGWRRLLAAQMTETLAVLRAEGIAPARLTAAPPWLVPHVLRLPTGLFRRIAARMLTVDAEARSSMQDDLRRGRPTEIDALQGEVLRRAARHGIACPVIEAVVAALRRAEAEGRGPPGLRPREVARL